MKKKRSSSKPVTPISLFRGAIGSKNPKVLADAMGEIKAKENVEKFLKFYSLATYSTVFSSIICAARPVKELRQLGTACILPTSSLSREMQWSAVICHFSRIIINKFISMRLDYFKKLEAGDFLDALQVLNQIDSECGKSLWTVENRISLLSVYEGFESQKKYVNYITSKFPVTNIAFMAAHIGERNEHRVTAAAFEQRLSHRAATWEIEPGQLSHIFFRLCNTIEPMEDSYAAILAHEASYSAVDLYESLLAIARRVKHMPFYDSAGAKAALNYLEDIADLRKNSLIEFLDGSTLELNHNLVPDYHLHFRRGDFTSAVDLAYSEMQSSPWNFDAIIAYSKACTAIGYQPKSENWLGKLIIPNLCSFFSGSTNAESAVDNLIKISNNFRNADFSTPLIILMKSRTHRWFYRISEQYDLMRIFSRDLFSFIEKNSLNSSFTENENFRNSSKMYCSIKNGRIEDALCFAKDLNNAEDLYYRTLGKSFLANLLARNLMTSEALEKSVETLVEHPGLVEFTPLIDIVKTRGNPDFKDLRGSAVLPTAFYIHIEHTESTDKEIALKVSWKNFLSSYNISKPSQFKPETGYSELEKFFLANVCTQETMELGGAFSSQLDLDRERMAICANLSSAFPDAAESFNQEIVDLARRINIEECVEYLESSRIFVDEIGIVKWAKKNLLSQFLRYKDHQEIGIDKTSDDFDKDIISIIEKNENFTQTVTNYLVGYDISADGLLKDVISELSRAFLQLSRYGLDSFLSSRVRHGSFVGYIRQPLESHGIVTKKSADTKKYYDNEFILQKWRIVDDKEKRILNQRLTNLSASVDSILDEVVEKYLHVKSKNYPNGMVAYTQDNRSSLDLLKSWVILARSHLNQDAEIEKFSSFCVQNLFWPSVRQSLDNLKAYIQGDLTEHLSILLNNFTESLGGLLSRQQRDQIQADIALANRDLRDALRRVSLWFGLPQVNTQSIAMPLNRVLEIGLISSQYVRFGFNPDVSWDVQSEANMSVHGSAVSTLNDLAFLIFTNIAKHSGFEDPSVQSEQAKIVVSINKVDGFIEVTISNNICYSKSLDLIIAKLNIISDRIKNGDFEAIDKQNEGTGLIRLAIYFDSIGLTNSNFVFWLSKENRMFNVKLILPKNLIKAVEI